MAIDYRILKQGQSPLAGSNIGKGVKEGMDAHYMNQFKKTVSDEYATGTPDRNRMLSGLGMVDPLAAMNDGSTSGKMSVFDKRRQATNTPEAKALLDRYRQVATELADARAKDPKFNIVNGMNELGLIEAEYKATTGSPMATTITSKMITTMAQDRGILETDEDDNYKAITELTNQVASGIDKDLKVFSTGAPQLKTAISLLQSAVNSETGDINPVAVNSAVKIYVKALDNSAVMQGEIAAIAGASLVEKIKGWVNGVFTGNKMSEGEIVNVWEALVTVAGAHNQAVKSVVSNAAREVNSRLKLTSGLGKSDQNKSAEYGQMIKDILIPRTSNYMVKIPGKMPTFKDVDFFSQEKAKAKSGGGDPYAGLF